MVSRARPPAMLFSHSRSIASLRWTLLAAWALVSACSPGDDDAPAFTVRDSAGVTIAENRESDPPRWSLVAAPVLELAGDEEGEEPFFRLRSVRALRGGGFVATHANVDIRYHDRSGRLGGVVGGDGEGPGEFRFLSWLQVLPGDTVVAWDHQLRRLSYFGPGRGFVSSTRVEFPPGPTPPGPHSFIPGSSIGVLPDGTALGIARAYVPFEGRPGRRGIRGTVVRVDTAGPVRDTVGTFQISETWEVTVEGRSVPGPVPFARVMRSHVMGDRFFVAEGRGRTVEVYAPDGTLLRSVRELRPLRPVTGEDMEAWVESQSREGEPSPSVRAATAPDSFPPWQDMVVDSDDRIWAAQHAVPGDTTVEWRVFDREGRLVGILETPEGFDVHDIRGDRIYGVWRSDLDVPFLRVYRFEEG